MKITVAGETFDTKKALSHRVKELLHLRDVGIELDQADHKFLLELLKRHPHAKGKIGPGVRAFRISISQYNNRFFEISRVDGTWDDFSAQKCVTGKSGWGEFAAALKAAVEDQILWARDDAFGWEEEIACPVTGEKMTRETCRVEHVPPDTLEELAARFAATEDVDAESPPATKSLDPTFLERWGEFHKANAKLRVVSDDTRLANQRKGV